MIFVLKYYKFEGGLKIFVNVYVVFIYLILYLEY